MALEGNTYIPDYASVNTRSKAISGLPGMPDGFLHTGKDLSGSTSAVVNYNMQQQQNAYEMALWNLNNEYNSPESQMQRFQMAGLNPNLIYKQSNATSGPAGSSEPIATKPTNYKAQNVLSAFDTASRVLGSLNSVLDQVQQTYDYAKYGVRGSQLRNDLLFNQIANTQIQGELLDKQNFIQKILTGEISPNQEFTSHYSGNEYNYKASDIPVISRYMLGNTMSEKNLEKLEYIINSVLPSQVSNTRAGTELRESEKAWNDNIRDFVGSINTGVPWLDSLLRAAMRVIISR